MRILLVEDEIELREPLVSRLKAEGYTVDPAADGKEGLFLGREYAIDLGIVDIGLPKLSGIDLIRALRKEEKKFSYPDPDRQRQLAGQGRGLGSRRRRLSDKTRRSFSAHRASPVDVADQETA
jgi:CheY-like chemotaxis protein